MSQRGELSDEPGRLGRAAPRIEILTAEQVGGGNDGSAQRAVFIATLRPSQVPVLPEIETHSLQGTMPTSSFNAWISSSGTNGFRTTRHE